MKARQSISQSISFFLMIIDLEIVLREFLSPTNMTKTQDLYIHRMTRIVIVSNDKNFSLIAVFVGAPSLKNFKNSRKLLIINLIPNFSQYHLLKKKNYRVSLTIVRLGGILISHRII